jgi:predicted nucleotide-binding protein (sugar kinase/HSP70/actin superfamily)
MAEFIVSSIVAIIGILMGMWVHDMISSSKHKDVEKQYQQRIGELERSSTTMRLMYDEMLKDRDEFCEKLVNKLLGDPTKQSNEVVVLDGKAYAISSYTLDHNPGEADTLTIECVRINIPD